MFDENEKIYIAGPMSGIEDHNKPAFMAAQEALIDSGIPYKNIFNPATSEASEMVQKGLVRNTQEAYRLCMAMDCKFICEEADSIFMLRGWEKSRGATAEHALAICLGLRIVYQ